MAELTRPDYAELLTDLDLAAAARHHPQLITRLIRAVSLFPSVTVLVGLVLTAHPASVITAVESLILIGPAGRAVKPLLIAALATLDLPDDDAVRLRDLADDLGWLGVCVVLQERARLAKVFARRGRDPGGL